jgi:hypothetical protein
VQPAAMRWFGVRVVEIKDGSFGPGPRGPPASPRDSR